MKLALFFTAALLLPILLWGFFGHQRINYLAALTIPAPAIKFYKQHAAYLSTHAVDADKRRYADTAEAPRHYLDVEHYENSIDSIPRRWTEAVARYGTVNMQKYGIVPWHIHRTYQRLVYAFSDLNGSMILRYAADLGHYVADAHVPLHTSSNHNGQLTGQTGIHAFWESRIPELFYKKYNLVVGRAAYVNAPLNKAWQIVKVSNSMVDTVLRFEALLNSRFPQDKKFTYSKRNNIVIRQYSDAYCFAYQSMINNMVERRMRDAILAIGSYWYSAWIDAGQPDLEKINFKNTEEPPGIKPVKADTSKIIGREI